MSRHQRVLIPVILLLAAGGAYFGWRHYFAPEANATAVTSAPASSDATGLPGEQSLETTDPETSADAADLAPDSAFPEAGSADTTQVPRVRGGRVPQNLNSLFADIRALHAACVEGRGCSETKWWDITVRLYASDAPVHLQELYAAVSRHWRSHLSAAASGDLDREFAIKLMKRAREWGY